MENIKVGDYAKHTKDGCIGKIVDFDDTFVRLDIGRSVLRHYIKTAENIIDLIQSGDYVNGYKVTDFGDDYYDYEIDDYIEGKSIVLGNEEQMYRIPPRDIKSIVTKEAFAQMEYKVGE